MVKQPAGKSGFCQWIDEVQGSVKCGSQLAQRQKIVDPVTERLPLLVPGQISIALSGGQLSKLTCFLLEI